MTIAARAIQDGDQFFGRSRMPLDRAAGIDRRARMVRANELRGCGDDDDSRDNNGSYP
jgi:hypothetical protein